MFDPQKLRQDFPILNRRIHGKPLVYLDNAATTQKPQVVLDAETNYYETMNANIHRGIHTMSEEATAAYEKSRAKIAQFIGASKPESVIFTRNTTESINLVADSWGRKNLTSGDEILLTVLEHHSNLVPWQMIAQATGAKLQFIPQTPAGELDMASLDKLLTSRTKMVAITAMSNAFGTLVPVKEIARRAHAVGAKVLVDGAQSAPHMVTRVEDLGCDFFAFSAHKMLGPTGIGILYGRSELLEAMDPFMGGGDMISQVWRERSSWNQLPWKFEAGTPNIAGAIAFGTAIDYLNALGLDNIRAHEKELTGYALSLLKEDPEIHIYGPLDPEKRGGVISFNYGTIHPHDIGTLLDQEGIAVRAGHHCAQPLMRDFGISGTARASFYIYNTKEEVDSLVKALRRAAAVFAGVGA